MPIKPLAKLKGDLLVFHVLKPVNGVVAVGKVISQIFEDYENIWEENVIH